MLAREFKRPDRRRMLAEMSGRELLEWVAYFQMEATSTGKPKQTETDMENILKSLGVSR